MFVELQIQLKKSIIFKNLNEFLINNILIEKFIASHY